MIGPERSEAPKRGPLVDSKRLFRQEVSAAVRLVSWSWFTPASAGNGKEHMASRQDRQHERPGA